MNRIDPDAAQAVFDAIEARRARFAARTNVADESAERHRRWLTRWVELKRGEIADAGDTPAVVVREMAEIWLDYWGLMIDQPGNPAFPRALRGITQADLDAARARLREDV